jgi:hypothetical protein
MEHHIRPKPLSDRHEGLIPDIDRVQLDPSSPPGLLQVVGVTGAQVIDDEYIPRLINE